jgi:hypothetical protein
LTAEAGQGNVIRKAEQLKELGVVPTKSLPPEFVEPAFEEPLPMVETEGEAVEAAF